MAGELGQALSAIDLSLNRKESRYQEFATLKSFQQEVEQDKQKEMLAQQEYNKYEDTVKEYSETLLERDRDKIKNLAKDGKEHIREQIKLHGGSYQSFMKNGGLRVLNKYKNSIVHSDDAAKYKKNSENLAHIIKVRDAGKAGLIMARDSESLKQYNAGLTDEITYSGLLSPIEQVDPSLYELGQKVPAKDILTNKNNSMAITSNFVREKGREPENEQELLEYVDKNYTQTGKNDRLQAQRIKAASDAEKNRRKDKNYLTVESSVALKMANKGASVIIDKEGLLNGGIEKNLEEARKYYPEYISEFKYNPVSETSRNGYNNNTGKTRPAAAREYTAYKGLEGDIAKSINSQYYNEETKTYDISADKIWGSDGAIMNDGEKRKLTPGSLILALTGKKGEGDHDLTGNLNESLFFVTEFTDNDGKPNAKQNSQIAEKLEGQHTQYRPWMSFTDDKGNIYYQPVDLEAQGVQSAISSGLGDKNDITEISRNKRQIEDRYNYLKQQADLVKAKKGLTSKKLRKQIKRKKKNRKNIILTLILIQTY